LRQLRLNSGETCYKGARLELSEEKRVIPEDAIRRRSYAIWEREGRPEGKAIEHWTRARTELEFELNSALSAPTDWSITVMPRVPISSPPTRTMAKRVDRSGAAVAA
jgi:hypothetical protein